MGDLRLRPSSEPPPPPSASGLVPPSSAPDPAGPAGDDGVTDSHDALRHLDDLRSDDPSSRALAARRLPSIAAAIGPSRTRDELLPFLCDGCDDDDEVLEAVASSIPGLIPHVGGPEHVVCLLKPLELLLSVEEGAVRDRAAEGAVRVSSSLGDGEYGNEYAGMVHRLAAGEWFTSRISACGLVPESYSRLRGAELRRRHVSDFVGLCRDPAPMVRRIASRNLGRMLYAVASGEGPSCLLPADAQGGEGGGAVSILPLLDLYEFLAGGDQPDSVRLHTAENCVQFGRAASHLRRSAGTGPDAMSDADSDDAVAPRIDGLVRRVLPLVVATIDDRSWRVRWTAASKFADVVKAFSSLDGAVDALVPAYEKLLQDPEAEVRTAATYNFAEVAGTDATVPSGDPASVPGTRVSVAARLAGRVPSLVEDDSENVRAALAEVATGLAPALGRDGTVAHLLPPLLLLLRDGRGEVRLNVISSLSKLGDVVGPELLAQSLLPAVLDLAEDGRWRIRLAVIGRMPLLAKELGGGFFTDRLAALCAGWLGDDISSVRDAAAANLRDLTALLGSAWSVSNLVPRVGEMLDHPSYLRRAGAVLALGRIAGAMDAESAAWEVLPSILGAASDPVPNVRFVAARALGEAGKAVGKDVYGAQIVPVLEMLGGDPDRDVRYFAGEAGRELGEHFDGRREGSGSAATAT